MTKIDIDNENTLLISRKLKKPLIINLKSEFNNPPCFNPSLHSKPYNIENYPLLTDNQTGCDIQKYNTDDFKLID